MQYVPMNDVYVYFRSNEKENLMVILNNNETEQTLQTERYAEGLNGKNTGKDLMSGKIFELSAPITVPKETALILELQ